MHADFNLAIRPASPGSANRPGVRDDDISDVVTEEEAAAARQIPSQLPTETPSLIQRALDAHGRDLAELIKSHSQQWVAYHGDRGLGFGRSKMQLIREYLSKGIPDHELLVLFVRHPDWDEADPGLAG
jgi:hypothetical protein